MLLSLRYGSLVMTVVNAADFDKMLVEIYQTTRSHSAKDSSRLRINNTESEYYCQYQ
jgi:hypothetical protein